MLTPYVRASPPDTFQPCVEGVFRQRSVPYHSQLLRASQLHGQRLRPCALPPSSGRDMAPRQLHQVQRHCLRQLCNSLHCTDPALSCSWLFAGWEKICNTGELNSCLAVMVCRPVQLPATACRVTALQDNSMTMTCSRLVLAAVVCARAVLPRLTMVSPCQGARTYGYDCVKVAVLFITPFAQLHEQACGLTSAVSLWVHCPVCR